MEGVRGWQRLYRGGVSRLALRMPFASHLLPITVPVTQVWHVAPRHPGRDLVVFLPGINDFAGDFAIHGFLAGLRRAGADADAVEVDIHLGYYLRQSLIRRLHRDVIESARRTGYQRLWLVGISLGGLGALHYAAEHGAELAGLVLIAPFLGYPRTIRAIHAAGGVHRWEPQPTVAANWERDVWAWVKQRGLVEEGPELWLGFGNQDPFAPANRMLAEVLPDECVFSTSGGHQWRTWRRLWETMLRAGLFTHSHHGRFGHRSG